MHKNPNHEAQPRTYQCFDAHCHIIDSRFPLVENQGYLPQDFIAAEYLSKLDTLSIKRSGSAIVSGSFQAGDVSYLLDAIEVLGDTTVGVINADSSYSDDYILSLHQQGIRAMRFNLFRGCSLPFSTIATLAQRVYDLAQWHVEFYLDASHLPDLDGLLKQLPLFSIDHLGLAKLGVPHLLKWVDRGARVKACGFMRTDFEVGAVLKQIHSVNPSALLFGSDLPGTRASRQFDRSDLDTITRLFTDDQVQDILNNNAMQWYITRFQA